MSDEILSSLLKSLDRKRLPTHVAIIPDGNGRWAELRNQDRTLGHVQGTANVKDLVIFAKDIGIKVVTIYAFSHENWNRPKVEVDILMGLLRDYLVQERQNILDNGIQLRTLGEIERLPSTVLDELKQTMELSAQNTKMILNFAISYGSRSEILRAVNKIIQDSKEGPTYPLRHASLSSRQDMLDPPIITEEIFSRYLYTKDLPDPDLLIRTSGEMRISNFLLWQMAYTELYVTPVLWPDFNRTEFVKALLEYQNRNRRYGLTQEQITGGVHERNVE